MLDRAFLQALGQMVLALLAAPLLPGIINKTKAWFAGRQGPPVLQLYWDLAKLGARGRCTAGPRHGYSAGPVISLAALLTALALVPCGGTAWAAFPGDLLLFAALLGLARFVTVTAALDTGSSFEGMGASREVLYSALAEPALLLVLASAARLTSAAALAPGADGPAPLNLLRGLSLSEMHANMSLHVWLDFGLPLSLIMAALILVTLVENCRIPFDDPNTHLELTMIHEVMVLDHGGPDLAAILYGASLKLWLLGSVLVNLLPVRTGTPVLDTALAFAFLVMLAVVVGVVESVMARLRLVRIPQVLAAAVALAALAFVLQVPAGQTALSLAGPLLILVILTTLALTAVSRLDLCIRIVAVQGTALGLLPLVLPEHGALGHVIVLALIGLVLKGVVFPWLLLRTLRSAGVRREVEPFVGYGVSAFGGVLALSLSLGLAASLNSLTPAGIRTRVAVDAARVAVPDADRAVPDRQPPQGPHPGAGLPGAGERHLPLWPDPGRRSAPAGRDGRAAGCVRRGVRDGHRHLPYQPRIRPHGRREAVGVEGLKFSPLAVLRERCCGAACGLAWASERTRSAMATLSRKRQIGEQVSSPPEAEHESRRELNNDRRPGPYTDPGGIGLVPGACRAGTAWAAGPHGSGAHGDHGQPVAESAPAPGARRMVRRG